MPGTLLVINILLVLLVGTVRQEKAAKDLRFEKEAIKYLT